MGFIASPLMIRSLLFHLSHPCVWIWIFHALTCFHFLRKLHGWNCERFQPVSSDENCFFELLFFYSPATAVGDFFKKKIFILATVHHPSGYLCPTLQAPTPYIWQAPVWVLQLFFKNVFIFYRHCCKQNAHCFGVLHIFSFQPPVLQKYKHGPHRQAHAHAKQTQMLAR